MSQLFIEKWNVFESIVLDECEYIERDVITIPPVENGKFQCDFTAHH